MEDAVLTERSESTQRGRLMLLAQRVTDDELEDAVRLLEWLTDPHRRYLVDQLAGGSGLAEHGAVRCPDTLDAP